MLNEEWLAVRAAREQREQCTRCGSPLPSKRDWYFASSQSEVDQLAAERLQHAGRWLD